jgi:YidC/Oxa1 family membrane protein insertase
MDRKSIAVIVLCMVLMFLWQGVLVPKYFSDKRPIPVANTNAVPTTTTGTQAVPPPKLRPRQPPAVTGAFVRPDFSTNASEELLVITNENARYTFTSRGGGLKKIELVKFPETISRKRRDQAAVTNFATLNSQAHLPVLTVLGGEALIGDGVFTLTQTATGVRAEKR